MRAQVLPPMLALALTTVDPTTGRRLWFNIISSDSPGMGESNETRYPTCRLSSASADRLRP